MANSWYQVERRTGVNAKRPTYTPRGAYETLAEAMDAAAEMGDARILHVSLVVEYHKAGVR